MALHLDLELKRRVCITEHGLPAILMIFEIRKSNTGSTLRSSLEKLFLLMAALLLPYSLLAQGRGAAVLGPLVQGLGVSGRVLVIAAHPDDEDTQLITWLARGRQVETAYLSLTRGDGGQNIIGNELGESLGAIRTEELLAARRMDGGKQYFTRAFDFGFSKSAQEALTQWSRDSLLRDVVTVIRAFRPHVIVSIFSGTPSDGHGHHQVAGILAREAYDASADTVRFPAGSTDGFGPWSALKFYRSANFRMQERATLLINVGEFDPLSGRSYAEIAADSRSQHKSQAMGALQPKGVRLDRLMREATRVGPADARSEVSIFDGVDTTWSRFAPLMRTRAQRAALDSLPGAFQQASSQLDFYKPGAVVPALVRIQRLLGAICGVAGPDNPCATLSSDSRRLEVRNADLHGSMEHASSRVERALALASNVAVEATAPAEVVAIGEEPPVTVVVYNRGNAPVRLTRRVILPAWSGPPLIDSIAPAEILPDSALRDSTRLEMRGPASQPWWLLEPRQGAMFGVAGSSEEEGGRRRSPTIVSFFEVAGGGHFATFTPVVRRYADPIRGEVNVPVAIAPAITLTLDHEVTYARADAAFERTIRVHVRSHSTRAREVEVALSLPRGVVADSSMREVVLRPGEQRTVSFSLSGSLSAGRHVIAAVARSGGDEFKSGYELIDYPHILPRRIYRDAVLGVEAVDVKLPDKAKIAYVNGVGDKTAPVLEQLGLDVTLMDAASLASADLAAYTSIVIGPRAYEASPTLAAANSRLMDFARRGGTVVVQYGQYEMLSPGMLPYPITLARPADRVTVEGSPVRIIDSEAGVLIQPNRITLRDFEGWVQDRSLYMPRTHDEAWRASIQMNDPGEEPNDGGILVAPVGTGAYVYTTLAFFRQLPNGVPGAARLFVNLLSARGPQAAQ